MSKQDDFCIRSTVRRRSYKAAVQVSIAFSTVKNQCEHSKASRWTQIGAPPALIHGRDCKERTNFHGRGLASVRRPSHLSASISAPFLSLCFASVLPIGREAASIPKTLCHLPSPQESLLKSILHTLSNPFFTPFRKALWPHFLSELEAVALADCSLRPLFYSTLAILLYGLIRTVFV